MSDLQAAIETVHRHAIEITEYFDFGEEVVAAVGLVCNAAERVPALEARAELADDDRRDAARYRTLRYAFSYDSPSGWFNDEATPEDETDAITAAMKQEADALREARAELALKEADYE